MITRRVIGCAVIFIVVLIRALVLEFYIYSPAIINNLWLGILSLAPIAFLLSIVIFLFLGVSKKIKMIDEIFDFLCSVVGWAFAGLGIASVIVIAISAYYASPQGPFSIIFLDGPLGAGLGTIVGFALWLLRISDSGNNDRLTSIGS